jgi:UDP-N-acetylglucosamine 2-epimerase (non-hydrolysing)
MSQAFFQDLELPKPDIYLGVGSGTHAEQTGTVMIELEKVLLSEKPDLVVVVGDVNSTLAAALAAVKLNIPVAHVEAGLRSYDRTMPEEINRLLTDQISDYLFTPSPDANANLKKEGIPPGKIFLVGNVMVDSLLSNRERADQSQILSRLKLAEKGYALLTLHRPSNVDEKRSLTSIMCAIAEISERIPVVFPAHPRTQKKLNEFGLDHGATVIPNCDELNKPNKLEDLNGRLLLIPPLGYLDFLKLQMYARLVMTDSGGIQEETTVLNVPCLTLRDTTERPITITQGTNVLVGNNPNKIIEEASRILVAESQPPAQIELWDGAAAERIVAVFVVEYSYNGF